MSLLRSAKARVARVIEGRQFVDLDDFLACYDVSAGVYDESKSFFSKIEGKIYIEKRDDDILYANLVRLCVNVDEVRGAKFSPIVTKDGWVIWLGDGHSLALTAIGALYKEPVDTQNSMFWDELALLRGGHGWYISARSPHIIRCGEAYQPTKVDREIFALFRLDYIC